VIEVHKLKSPTSVAGRFECHENFPLVASGVHSSSVPLLVVFSNDLRLKEINYETLEKKLSSESGRSDIVLQGTESHHRKKRALASCSLHSLVLPTSAVFISPNIIDSSSFSITSPTTFDAGICGGYCRHNPPHSNVHHTLLVNLYLKFPSSHGYRISQCCLPVSYRPLILKGSEEGASIVEKTLENMSISFCGCVDVAN